MSRPLRIEYENAFYHVMNRGRARQFIFHDEAYYLAFLETISEACTRFKCIVHAYCLMGNHYHILIETPKGDLSRIMRHINGVYTQRHNRLQKTDGPLFRGRYKAILVDGDAYLLQLSRYIHLNPMETKPPLVANLADYLWSSYPAYIGRATAPDWLAREKTRQMLGHENIAGDYEQYVLRGVDKTTAEFYRKGNAARIIGDNAFKEWIYEELLPELDVKEKSKALQPELGVEVIVEGVGCYFGVGVNDIREKVTGPHSENLPRKIAMYLCQQISTMKLADIATEFNLSNIGSVSTATHQVRRRCRVEPEFTHEVDCVIQLILKKDRWTPPHSGG
jgi:putative transposase